ncbi:hypothetical protein J3Q64DRAFT_1764458 [Phycomyces blakesleeanus]|uniref:D-xylose 1-dehydrogenase (NADP(+), D-xylono-1,5-lactone-forming) n=2 Tax=Phycomyces blakesleeanus TaxID=4837 RepID=A0A163D2I4_PHYB8|nr:hypothetical protein PHYBLDRAFT_73017 [Phycomyces blakesleeanus NRRL 1555(-)]OAD68250.1 hypothetical protein PHYBLDRAFT_73017 [Phycomyces blakesleeanus NRRL 1555(-)]|eukprot:XP_018286290.1 hypothetical protein PHYBLDRAFT_73017 [Phycomyces blakesleeanus NRRL 1555(-)]
MSLRWGILGTGNIATTFANGLKQSPLNSLVAIGSRSDASAQAFGQAFGVTKAACYGTYDALLADPNVDIVYIATPHPQHCELAIKTAKAKKHMLVEKPMAMNEREVQLILDAAKENDVFLMEAYMYRCHPQTQKAAEMIKQGVVGEVKLVKASFSFEGYSLGPSSRLWRNELGGGALMDIGGYPLSWARLIAGAAQGSSPLHPTILKGVGNVQKDTQVDEWAMASLGFENKIGAQLFVGVFADADCSVEVVGTKGTLRVPNLWRPDLAVLGPTQIEVSEHGKAAAITPIVLEQTNLFTFEAEAVAKAVLSGKKECDFMTWEDSLSQVRSMDQWRKEIGLVYSADKQ